MAKKNALVEAQLAPLRADLEARRAQITKELEPLYAQRDALLVKMAPLDAELRAVQAQIKPAEVPLREIGSNLAAIARSIGSTSLTLDAGETKAEPGEIR